MELTAHSSYSELRYDIRFWRTKSGLEVDFILGDGEVAVEVKGTSRVDARDLRPVRAFVEEHAPRTACLVRDEPAERVSGGVRIAPRRDFLGKLWAGVVVG